MLVLELGKKVDPKINSDFHNRSRIRVVFVCLWLNVRVSNQFAYSLQNHYSKSSKGIRMRTEIMNGRK